MDKKQTTSPGSYTCSDYREEMILLGLHRRLQEENLDEEQRRKLLDQIAEIEKQMGL